MFTRRSYHHHTYSAFCMHSKANNNVRNFANLNRSTQFNSFLLDNNYGSQSAQQTPVHSNKLRVTLLTVLENNMPISSPPHYHDRHQQNISESKLGDKNQYITNISREKRTTNGILWRPRPLFLKFSQFMFRHMSWGLARLPKCIVGSFSLTQI